MQFYFNNKTQSFVIPTMSAAKRRNLLSLGSAAQQIPSAKIRRFGMTMVFGIVVLAITAFGGCARRSSNTLRVGVTPGPAGEILESIRADLQRQGVELKIIPFTDYI